MRLIDGTNEKKSAVTDRPIRVEEYPRVSARTRLITAASERQREIRAKYFLLALQEDLQEYLKLSPNGSIKAPQERTVKKTREESKTLVYENYIINKLSN